MQEQFFGRRHEPSPAVHARPRSGSHNGSSRRRAAVQ
jgi:hypothetical protein